MAARASFDRGRGGSSTALTHCTHSVAPAADARSRLCHQALLYADSDEYVDGIRRLTIDSLEVGEPVLISVPEPRLRVLRSALEALDGPLTFLDMRQRGRNPARILPLIRAFADEHPDRRVRFLAEPIWPERAAPEIVEGHRHEALVNVGLGGCNVDVVCFYDTARLEPDVVAEAMRTHPTVIAHGERRASEAYIDPLTVYAAAGHPLPPPAEGAIPISLHEGLAGVRRDVEQHVPPELARDRVADLVVAANEAAANTIRHAGGRGGGRMWRHDGRIVVEVADVGVITDPFVGRRLPDILQESGRGVWLMHQLCDLVELRSGPDGTVVRLHMSFD